VVVVVLVFYISGHGLGHASRDIEIINSILLSRPDTRVVVRTSAPRWFFDTFVRGSVELHAVEVDTGVTQVDSLRLDERDTADRARQFYASFPERAEREARVLGDLSASVVVADLPPLAVTAAARAGVPSVAVGNFTWDWIYAGYPEFERRAPGVMDLIGAAYGQATAALRLPFCGGFATMAAVTRDIPLIARHATHRRGDVRRALGIGKDAIVVLASFGGYGLQLHYEEIARDGGFALIVADRESTAGPSRLAAGATGLLRVDIEALAKQGLYYPDLVAASDVVVSKPGYGIVSECIANGAALLYTDRGRFSEHDIFVADMPRVLRCRFISRADLMSGRWKPAVEALLGQDPPPARLATNGADVAAQTILDIADRSHARA
jgi:L-arabinokinase